jgi:hypothetical protein
MLLLKRIFTSLVLLLVFTWIFYYGGVIVAGFIVGLIAALHNLDAPDKQDIGRQAALEFLNQHVALVAGIAVGIALIAALALSFSGVLPWCRRSKV